MVFAIFFGGGTLKAFYFLLGLEASYPSFIESFVGNLSKKNIKKDCDYFFHLGFAPGCGGGSPTPLICISLQK